MLTKLFYFSTIIILSTFYFLAPADMNKAIMLLLLIIALVAIILFFLKKENNQTLKGQFLKHTTIILIGYCIVHFQYYLDFVLGNILSDNLYIWVNQAIVLKAFI